MLYYVILFLLKKNNFFLKGKIFEWGEILIYLLRLIFRNFLNMNVEFNYFEYIKDLVVFSKKVAKYFVRKVY